MWGLIIRDADGGCSADGRALAGQGPEYFPRKQLITAWLHFINWKLSVGGGQWTTSAITLEAPFALVLFFATGSLIASELWESSCLHFFKAEVTSVHSQGWRFWCGLYRSNSGLCVYKASPLTMGVGVGLGGRGSFLLHGLKYVVKLVSLLFSGFLTKFPCSAQKLAVLPLLAIDLEFESMSRRGNCVTSPL